MRLLMVGGSRHHLGGVEAFCDRSTEALERQGNWNISRVEAGTAYLTFRRLPSVFRSLKRLFDYRNQGVDCLWLQYVSLPDLAYLIAAKLLGYRVVVTPHLGANWRSQSVPVLRAVSGWMLRFADRLALISKTQELELNLPSNVPRSYIRNFLPASILESTLPDEESSRHEMQLMHSSRLSEGKGTFLFVEVCANLRSAGVPFFARITGGADKETFLRLRRMIAERDLESHVEVLGRVPDPELIDLMRGSDILIHLSKIDSYPLIVLESTACCMFPVCMDLAGARDMVNTYGGHIVSESAAIAETTMLLSERRLCDIRAESRDAARKVRSDYAWSKCVHSIESALALTFQNSQGAQSLGDLERRDQNDSL